MKPVCATRSPMPRRSLKILLGGPSITSHVPVAAGTRVLPRSLRKPATAASPPAESASTEAALTRLALPALPSCAARRSPHFKRCVRVIFGNFSFATFCEVFRAESWAILFMIVYGNGRLRRQPKLCLRNKKQFFARSGLRSANRRLRGIYSHRRGIDLFSRHRAEVGSA